MIHSLFHSSSRIFASFALKKSQMALTQSLAISLISLVFAVSFVTTLSAATCAPLTFQQLEEGTYNGKKVEVRGFLYQKEDGSWILAAEPNLRTCCVGDPAKKHITLPGDFSAEATKRVVTLQGSLILSPDRHYRFDRGVKIVPETSTSWWLLFPVLIAFILGWRYYARHGKKI